MEDNGFESRRTQFIKMPVIYENNYAYAPRRQVASDEFLALNVCI